MIFDHKGFGLFIKKTFLVIFLFAMSASGFGQATGSAEAPDWETELISMLNESNKLYSTDQGDLSLATDLLKTTAFNGATNYYRQADLFYFFSLDKSSFDKNPEALEQEANRIIPLLDDSLHSRWEGLIKEKDDDLVSKISRFWHSSDPVVSTKFNERLFEYWYRIAYAQKHFSRNTTSPYNTDDRGMIFVKFGAPDMNISRTLRPGPVWLTGLYDTVTFDLSLVAEKTDYILWQYKTSPNSNYIKHYYLFGERFGREEFGLRKDPVELLNFDYIKLQIPTNDKERLYQQLFTYKIFKELTVYNSDYGNIYTEIENAVNMSRDPVRIFKQSVKIPILEGRIQHSSTQRLKNVSPTSSNLLDRKILESSHQVYRFLNNQNKTEFALAIRPNLSKFRNSFDSSSSKLYLNAILSSYPSSGKKISRTPSAIKVNPDSADITSLHFINDKSDLNQPLYYSMELIDPTEASITIPTNLGINPQIKGTTGQQKIKFPNSLSRGGAFIISDIILTNYQNSQNDKRIPIVPTLQKVFKQDQKVMIFFETYNLPKGGYQFEYYFERKRTLLKNRKVEEKPSVTVIRDKVAHRDQQLFSINLTDLKPATYDLVITFSPLSEKSSDITTKRIELTIED